MYPANVGHKTPRREGKPLLRVHRYSRYVSSAACMSLVTLQALLKVSNEPYNVVGKSYVVVPSIHELHVIALETGFSISNDPDEHLLVLYRKARAAIGISKLQLWQQQ